MRATELFSRTLREVPHEAEVASHALLLRGGFIRRVASGIYAWLPLGLRVLRKVEKIIREEIEPAGATEILMPALLPSHFLDQTGRSEAFGSELYRLKDPSGGHWYLGPTHEEIVTFLASSELPSYKDLPKTVFQVQWKYRFAPRPRGGLLRAREFLMKDAYSFDADEDSMAGSYKAMREAYERSFRRCGLDARRVEAEAGVMGGLENEEFLIASNAGEDSYVECANCDYAAKSEVATGRSSYPAGEESPMKKIKTADMITVDEVTNYLQVDPTSIIKALLIAADRQVVCALVPGDRDLDLPKLSRALEGKKLRMLTEEEFTEHALIKGFAGPVGLSGITVIADHSLGGRSGLVAGANEVDHHLVGVSVGRDFVPEIWADLTTVREGDACSRCGSKLALRKGIEIGHIFQLGTKYSDAMNARFTDRNGKQTAYVMGCYGFGISRTVAAIAETHRDEKGITWPLEIAPFAAAVLLLSQTEEARKEADRLCAEMEAAGIEVLLDDREVSPGVKFTDADLIGYPFRIVFGKTWSETGRLEIQRRLDGDRFEIPPSVDEIVALVR